MHGDTWAGAWRKLWRVKGKNQYRKAIAISHVRRIVTPTMQHMKSLSPLQREFRSRLSFFPDLPYA
jgi:hypothetical protein